MGLAHLATESVPSLSNFENIAFYLPQYHPTEDNNRFWGEGFTEWTNVARAKPLYKDHIQPVLPSTLGFYDLRIEDTYRSQWKLASAAGITGFCLWYYWFGGNRRTLELPLELLLAKPHLDFRYCLGWANESWTGIWHGAGDDILIEQRYEELDTNLGILVEHFRDPRYIKVLGRPVLYILRPDDIPDLSEFVARLAEACSRSGLGKPYLVGEAAGDWLYSNDPLLDAYCWNPPPPPPSDQLYGDYAVSPSRLLPAVYNYDEKYFDWILEARESALRNHPCVIVGFDNTPRSGRRGVVLEGRTPELLHDFTISALSLESLEPQPRIVFYKSWNEWAEGSILEPDLLNGRKYLDAFTRAITRGHDS